MTTWYRASNYSTVEIEPVEPAGETTSFLIFSSSRRVAKTGTTTCYFPTWDEAKAWLIERTEADLAQARRRLQYAQDRHGNAKGLKPPTQ